MATEDKTALTWGLVIATKDRLEPLKTCVRLALRQSHPPSEVVVADSSADWAQHASEIAEIIKEHTPDLRCVYEQGQAPSLTVQRNQALSHATADIVFMIDDDSFMHPTCAEEIMRIYQADTKAEVAGVQASESPDNPADETSLGAQKTGDADLSRLNTGPQGLKWFMRKVMMRSKVDVFIPYDKDFPKYALPEALAGMAVAPVELFGGFRMTYRRAAVMREGFEPALRYYCPGEDLDASYRVSRYGMLLTARNAVLHHYAAASGRLNRLQVAHLWSFNQAVLLRRHAPDQFWAPRAFARKMAHRIITDVVKDLLMRRFTFPQSRGSWRAWRDGRRVFDMPQAKIESWYIQAQERIIKG